MDKQATQREMVIFSIRIDKRIADQLNVLARKDDWKRNKLIENILAEKCGLILNPYYEPRKTP